MPAASSILQPPRVNTAASRSRPIDNTRASVLHCGKCVLCHLSSKLTGPAMDQLKEMFGPLVKEQLGAMDWVPVKREADGETRQSPQNGTGQGKPWLAGPLKQATLAQSWRQGAPCRWPPSDPNAQGPCQADAPTGDCAQDPSPGLQLGPLRSAGGNQGPLPLLYAAAQKWKKAQEENATTTTLRTPLFGCLIQMLHTGLKDIGSEGSAPFQKKAEEMK